MGYISKNWSDIKNGLSLSEKVIDKVKPGTSLKNRINDFTLIKITNDDILIKLYNNLIVLKGNTQTGMDKINKNIVV